MQLLDVIPQGRCLERGVNRINTSVGTLDDGVIKIIFGYEICIITKAAFKRV